MKTYRELEKLKKEQRAKLLKRFSELKTEQDEVCKQLRDRGDVAILTPRYTELANAVDEVKRELEGIGEIYSTDNLAETCGSIEAIWEELFPAERYKLAHQLIDKITLFADHIVMDVKHYGLKSLIGELKTDQDVKVYQPENCEIIQLNIQVLVKRWNGRKLIITPDEKESEPELPEHEPTAMAKRLAQAHKWTEMLEEGEYATVAQLADAVDYDLSKTLKILNLASLSPKIQKMIVEDNIPQSMALRRLYGNIPVDWEEQEQEFGISNS
ncbi:MAG: hypothetical protein PHH77_10815 [Victivallaceae bacterium]|nr:hypothetical protein [Victivallaceae bacterium]